MAKWIIKEEASEIQVSYVDDRGEQSCGHCPSNEKPQLLGWLYSPGQVDRFDVVVMGSHEFFSQPGEGRA